MSFFSSSSSQLAAAFALFPQLATKPNTAWMTGRKRG